MPDKMDAGTGAGQARHGGVAMALMMMACCLAVIAVFALIPVVGWPIGLVLGAATLIGMALAHQRWMGHGSHH